MNACWNCRTPLKDNTMVSSVTGSEFCLTCCCLVKDNARQKQGGQDGHDSDRAAAEAAGDRSCNAG